MEFRTRHIAIVLYGGITALAIILKPELINTMQDLLLATSPFIAMFTWDKIKGGSISGGTTTPTTG